MIKILIADDELIERRYLKDLFDKYPELYTVVGEAKNGQEVFRQVAQQSPDVIILDINMPLIDGLTSAREIKLRYPNIIILLNTAYAEFEFAKKALDYRLDAYLLKPAGEALILQTIENCIRNRRSAFTEASNDLLAIAPELDQDPIDRVVDYIDHNLQQALTLDALAEIAHFTPSYLSRVFHERKGMTVTAYIAQVRIEQSKFFLVHSSISIQEVAYRSGFQSTSNFNRVFKQHTGLTPLEWRHRNFTQET